MKSKDEIISILKKYERGKAKDYGVEKIGIFGSVARDDYNKDSDIDIYVEFKNKTFKNISGLWVFLEELYNKKIDLMHKHKRSNGAIFDKIQKEVIYG